MVPKPASGRSRSAAALPTDPGPPSRLEWLLVAAFTLAGLALRVALWGTQTIPSVDGTAYLRIAQSFAGGPPIDTVHQYGYPLLIRLAQFVVPDWVTAARVVAFVPGVLAVPLTWWVARRFVDPLPLRFLPVAAMALTPLPVRYSLTTMTDLPFMALLLLGLGAAARGRWLAAGLLGGAGYVIRPEGLLAALAVAALLVVRRQRAAALRVVVGALLFVVPYIVFVGLKDDRWTLTPKSINIGAASWQAAEERAGEADVPIELGTRLERFGAETAREYPKRAFEVLAQLFRQCGYVPLLIGPVGLAGPAILLGAGLVQIVFLPLTFIGARVRYVFPFLPILWILTSVVLARVPRPALRTAGTLLVIGGIALAAVQERALYTLNEDGWFPELVEAGVAMRDLVRPETVVYDRKPYTAYYAGAIGRYTPTGSYDAILDQLVRDRGDFLVVNDRVTASFRPELLPLIRDPRVVATETRLSPVYFEQSTRGQWTAVYRIVRPGGPAPMPGEAELRQAMVGVLSR
jgi:hypothetical protein